MPSAVGLRTDFSAVSLRHLATTTKNANQSRRLLSLAAVLDGMNRTDAARIGGMDRQTLRDWVHRFNAGGPDGLTDKWAKGHPPRLSLEQQREVAGLVDAGPDRAVDGVVRWRRVDLQRVIRERFGVAYHERTVGKLLATLGFSHISARPRHPAQDDATIAAFKKKSFPATLTAHLAHLPKSTPVEVWYQDEARIGQKNGLVRQWARTGSRPRQPADQRYESTYLFGAICPARGTGAALAMPHADTEAMQAHLDEIARTVARHAHAVLLLDRAGWHTTGDLIIPKNMTLVFLPPRSPELNPVETIWQYLRANWLSNRVFETYDDIIDAACDAWNRLIAQPGTIISIGLRDWALIGHT